ncbi:MAG: cystathionine beta-lyase [Alphaproteobacteria bacterium]
MAESGAKGGRGTRLVAAGRRKDITGPFVNPPAVHASTVLFDSVTEMYSGETKYAYGRRGTPTLAALEEAIAELEGADGTVLCPSGLNAISTALLALSSAGDHILLPDSIYEPGRFFADTVLSRLGISVTYYDPTVAGGVGELMNADTRIVYVESPGSITMEMQDIPSIAAAARARGVTVVADNTWATPIHCRPLDLGADVALLSATKYIGGHSDLMMGTASANGETFRALKRFHGAAGLCVAPDDAYLALRGMRTIDVRLSRHQESALMVARWLHDRPEVARVLHPGLDDDPGHALWQRDMTGSSGLFSLVLRGGTEKDASAVLDALELFGLGYSWGGFESLAIIGSHGLTRTASPVDRKGPIIRLHIGLEDPDDLIADLEQALQHFRP